MLSAPSDLHDAFIYGYGVVTALGSLALLSAAHSLAPKVKALFSKGSTIIAEVAAIEHNVESRFQAITKTLTNVLNNAHADFASTANALHSDVAGAVSRLDALEVAVFGKKVTPATEPVVSVQPMPAQAPVAPAVAPAAV